MKVRLALHRSTFVVACCALTLAAGCIQGPASDRSDDSVAAAGGDHAGLPAELTDPSRTPDAELLLPQLGDYLTDDEVESGEIESSLDHGSVPYVEVRRRLIMGEDGFARGEVTAVTFQPDSGGVERYVDHTYGDAVGSRVELRGVEMMRIAAEPYDVLVWPGPNFIVTFARGQEVTADWVEDLAAATVAAIARGR